MPETQLVVIRRNKEKRDSFKIEAPRYLEHADVSVLHLVVLQKAGCTIVDGDALLRHMAETN